jgi:HSP20 family protein
MTQNDQSVTKRADAARSVQTDARQQQEILTPSADIVETPESFVLMLDMPGVAKDSLSVSMDQNLLKVKGTVEAQPATGGELLFREMRATGYDRTFNIGEGVDRNRIDAAYEHGVLTVTLPKREEMKPREITIR